MNGGHANFKMKTPKIILDTLTDKDGRYSRKSLTTLVFVVMSVMTGSFIVVSDYLIPESKEINQYAIMVFFGFLGKSGYDLYLTLKEKMQKPTLE